jgi:hypothetical protein
MIEVRYEYNALYLLTKYNKKMSHSAVVEILKRLEGVSYLSPIMDRMYLGCCEYTE